MRIKSFRISGLFLLLSFFLIASCGGGGGSSSGSGDRMTVTVNGVTTTYVENIPYAFDPIMIGYVMTDPDPTDPIPLHSTHIDLTSGFNMTTGWDTWVSISIDGESLGEHIISDASTWNDVFYETSGVGYFARSGSINIEKVEGIGGRIKGTFSAIVESCFDLPCTQLNVSGSFDVTRDS